MQVFSSPWRQAWSYLAHKQKRRVFQPGVKMGCRQRSCCCGTAFRLWAIPLDSIHTGCSLCYNAQPSGYEKLFHPQRPGGGGHQALYRLPVEPEKKDRDQHKNGQTLAPFATGDGGCVGLLA